MLLKDATLESGLSFAEFVRDRHIESCVPLFLFGEEIDAVATGPYPSVLRKVELPARIQGNHFVPGHPPLYALRRWRREQPQTGLEEVGPCNTASGAKAETLQVIKKTF